MDDECGRHGDGDRDAALWWATRTAVAAFVDYRQPSEAD